ncbi:uncharacterized protein LOC126745772 isoform X2 [Anthonomus grandis grandis]|uniref:uncharacterized protein LOC126745772 isoform X2 n=1 Tax=Anthonomus grandis grandis TaxID=2921223 RepID=UPI0021653D64|nr:uncharacterized protein LOC126745772 isoform X2 [Anthonomus grandis grandis]
MECIGAGSRTAVLKRKVLLTCLIMDSRYRKGSFIEQYEEDIEVKPAVDLIPDEYERDDNRKFLVEMFYSEKDGEAKAFRDFLLELGFVVDVTLHEKQRFDKSPPDGDWLAKVQDKIVTNKYEGLMMVFAKVEYKNVDIRHVWSRFTAPNCPTLKDKPKIFLFQILKRQIVDVDAVFTRKFWSATYDTPAEADIAVIYDKYDSDQDKDILSILTGNIQMYGYKEDLISLITIGSGLQYRPMIMSTMTKKFYFQIYHLRGHIYNVLEKHDTIKQSIEKIKEKIQQPDEKKTKVKKSNSVSFRKNNMGVKMQTSDEVNKRLSTKPPIGTSEGITRRPQGNSTSDDKTRSKHSSTISGNSSASSLNTKLPSKKPIWKP